jgi:prepilin-type N-terminal cleavage/methylation domain-containing protein
MHVSGMPASAGFTLIELLVSLAIAALLVMLATPSVSVWLADAQVRTGAQTVAGGLRYAQAEAIKRNENVQLILDSATKTGGWRAEVVSATLPRPALQTGVFIDGAERAQFVTTPAGNNTVTFTGLGQVAAANDDASPPFERVVVSIPAVADSRPLTVLVGNTAGRAGIKICDPQWDSPPRPAPDPKGCFP